MQKVKAVIIGAARAGTTTLASYMGAHPLIDFSKEKEVHYFSFDNVFNRGEKYLNSFFKNDRKFKITADTYLLVDKKAPERVKKYNPYLTFILILRDPVLRAFSGYTYSVRNGYLKKGISFIDACIEEKEHENSDDIVLKNNKCNILRSKYFENLQFWTSYFPKENFLLLKTSDLNDKTSYILEKISGFLDIENLPVNINNLTNNKAFTVRSRTLQQLLVNRKPSLQL